MSAGEGPDKEEAQGGTAQGAPAEAGAPTPPADPTSPPAAAAAAASPPAAAAAADGVSCGDAAASGSSSASPAVPPQPHLLEDEWTLWFDSPRTRQGARTWKDGLHNVADIATVEAFWGCFSRLKAPSQLDLASTYHLFRKGVQPEWEDPANKDGGKWVVTLSPAMERQVDRIWRHLLLRLLGGTLESDLGAPPRKPLATGAVLGRRKGRPGLAVTRLALWTCRTPSSGAREELQRLGKRLREVLGLDADTRLAFDAHAASGAGGPTGTPTSPVAPPFPSGEQLQA
eukprot:TRINITY_DN23_c0_g2_i1.p1 TRINITY_DN23_c0_g2~~TRINITY_DN23_c0_g2_i1.p1  ORF type:complete len:312 (+),score=81.91 TRINITY_DN23_c0_g2_i1:80-937(+)